MRLIATEEAFAPTEYIDEYLKLSAGLDSAASRYLAAHSPTMRAHGQTYQIAERLHRGDRLFEE